MSIAQSAKRNAQQKFESLLSVTAGVKKWKVNMYLR